MTDLSAVLEFPPCEIRHINGILFSSDISEAAIPTLLPALACQ